MLVEGGCHCGLVRFQASVPSPAVTVSTCDCSICGMAGTLHLTVPDKDFRLIEGKSDTATYRFGSGKARHVFCTQCGVKSFFRPDLSRYTVDFRCLDEGHGLTATMVGADGNSHPGRAVAG